MKRFILIYTLVLLIPAAALAQGSAFNFQGRLNDGANPANGRYDLEFRLFNAVTGGTQIGAVVSRPNTILINGVFSVTLDFGAAAFNNPNSVFIEIGVRPNSNPNPFTILGPRQQLTAVPFALRALNATNADNAVNAQTAVNAQSAVNATNATNSTTATIASNALSLGGVAASSYAKLDVINPGQFVMDGNVRQSAYSNGLIKAMVEVRGPNGGTGITRCYNGATNSSTGNCGFVMSEPIFGVRRINFGFPVSSRFVAVSAEYADGAGNHNIGVNYRIFDDTSIEVFTYITGSEDTVNRSFTIILF